MWQYIVANDKRVFLSLLFFGLVIRFATFIPTVIDPDESTYLVMAHQLLNGDTLYVETTDIKPFGIYVFFAGLLKIAKSVVFVRFVALLLIVGSAFMLYKIKAVFTDNVYLCYMVALVFIALMSTPFGFSFNTEILFVFFTIGGLYLFTRKKWQAFSVLTGFVLGLGFMTKYLMLFDVLAFFSFFFIYRVFVLKEVVWYKFIGYSLVSFLGFLIPFCGAHFYYYSIDHYKDFHFVTYVLPFNYQGEKDVMADLDFMSGIHQRYTPFLVLFYLSLLNFKSNNEKHVWEKLFVFTWFCFVLFSIYFPGAHFRHYYLQAIPVISFMVPSILFENEWISEKLNVAALKNALIVCLGLITVAYSGFWTNHYLNKQDAPKELVNYLSERINPEDKIHATSALVVHVLLNKKSLCKYVHPTLIMTDDRIEAFQIDVPKECETVLGRENKPKYWIREEREVCDNFGWKEYYKFSKDFGDGLLLFERIE